ncbi:hypothetical protein [Simiduia agarivorans]|uniref:Type II secretory pathway ATPase PulE/Tfp pilus assembly pathway ATPase PilB n=1 Tax=Simiduia agarivorans (strain DSM 21679 / JCM 13881 / BCRC 17597 / SA1) TaxID=1117647 RepID=K4KIR1_SIMAS|nr:hypothetical protein [Simiduia agarivorans]AFU99039.2 type II secretory pathway ATPase PulE/Tfp pilus assembly pathway ATPase PilB [Simiduia agarivorans SA1 = DSM 21679]
MSTARLGDILLARNWIGEEQLNRAIREQARSQLPLGQILLAQASISERQLKRALRWQRFARAALLMGSLGAAAAPVGASEAQRLTDQLVERIGAQSSSARTGAKKSTGERQNPVKTLLGTPTWTLLQGRYSLGADSSTEGVRYQARWSASKVSLEIRYQF